VRELRDAASKVQRKQGARKTTPEERAANASAKDVRAWLKKRGAKEAGVTVRKTKGAFWITIEVRADAAKLLVGD
jgi:hypothetical protein